MGTSEPGWAAVVRDWVAWDGVTWDWVVGGWAASAVVEREIGSGSVSEASVLARGAELIVEKH
ncbi:cobalamin biosynthesis protein, partial [Propionibacterium freudenreichii]|uniref:cobalamin biosynthesis protein n=1 Tax=Propionibacterium freudenreichii TaxID=1744 RepID=UPI00254DA324